ncbi:carbohydrate kinase family protein [Phototrophicus methaneseepsis]|uniref:Carbohydrate kinase family protein n=1 Tax=Phototrophicus methaneseepsis TaxID=2710758 RepID=A0A7S8IG23_9CHLR|nr:carbohydrate kinase family protein [Phototrophicus methaneseepsis]QPC83518.1 carbohydrate kinase family protein [Phototrophicus methaneseepsis]
MTSIVALGAVTVGIDLPSSHAELREVGLTPGSDSLLPVERMEAIRLKLENNHGELPVPTSGGSVGNTANLLARAGVSCGFMGIGGNDTFGRIFVTNCEKASLEFLCELEDGAVTGYDFYLYDEDDVRTIILTYGANALLNPARVDLDVIQKAELVLLDGIALSFGPESETAMLRCVQAAEAANVPFVLALAGTGIVAGYREFFNTFAPKAQMVAGNLEQVAVLVGLGPEASLDEVRIELMKTPIDAVVTLDADGAFARFGNDVFLMPTQKIEAVDSTGAGDNFLAGFLIARRQGLSVRQALAFGNVIAGEVIRYRGAQLPSSFDVPKLMLDALQIAESVGD